MRCVLFVAHGASTIALRDMQNAAMFIATERDLRHICIDTHLIPPGSRRSGSLASCMPNSDIAILTTSDQNLSVPINRQHPLLTLLVSAVDAEEGRFG
jgi:hypothetical protein